MTTPEERRAGVVLIDGIEDGGIPQELFEFMQQRYWVLAFKGDEARGADWLLSPSRPIDVPNGMMVWRRPTYVEALAQRAWADRGRKPNDHLLKYHRSGPVPPLCDCGHGEDSHPTYMPCRMTCRCRGFRAASEQAR